jgi:hypothetical protein
MAATTRDMTLSTFCFSVKQTTVFSKGFNYYWSRIQQSPFTPKLCLNENETREEKRVLEYCKTCNDVMVSLYTRLGFDHVQLLRIV